MTVVNSYGWELENRLVDFAVLILKLTASMTNVMGARTMAKQLTRSGTAPALNYAEARAAESDRDFIHKMKLCLKELRESHVSLQIIHKMHYGNEANVKLVSDECHELVAIFYSSIRTRQNALLNKQK